MSRLPAFHLRGLGAWATGLPGWSALRDAARGGAVATDAPRRPTTELLPANERRRAPDTVLLALSVAEAACADAQADPATLPSVFASMHGDLTITDVMCETLARAPHEISPTKFHNSVHNAAAGYWTIGVGCHASATALSAYQATLAQGLVEALMQLADGSEAVLLVASDGPSAGPLSDVSRSTGLLGLGLVLARCAPAGASGDSLRVDAELLPIETAVQTDGPLHARLGDNAMAPALALIEALALGQPECRLHAGAQSTLVLRFHGRWDR